LDLLERVDLLARKADATTGIGSTEHGDAAEAAAALAVEDGLGTVRVFRDGERLVKALSGGKIDAAVRGTLAAKDVLPRLMRATGHRTLGRAALMQDRSGQAFLLTPVGIDEGNSLESRARLLEGASKELAYLGKEPRAVIMSKGRPEDRKRGEAIDASLSECRRLADLARDMGIEAECMDILIEGAIGAGNIILAPDGVTGNLIFRTLHHVAGFESWGALALHLLPSVYVDTSRAKRDYLGAIKWAIAATSLERE
jgi:predicted methyltransferase MtxX (methanogen marker protein 4)